MQQPPGVNEMDWQRLVSTLFPDGHMVSQIGYVIAGAGTVRDITAAVIGTTGHAAIGIETALALAGHVLDVVRAHPRRPILLLVDTQGQRLRRHDELLGINGYLAHLAQCVELARARGHRVIGLAYGEAVSGGFLASGMIADATFALPQAQVRVMNLEAMARVTKIPLERLETLAQTSPVFAPGPENFLRLGGLEAIWAGDLAGALHDALTRPSTGDRRRVQGFERGGRQQARPVSDHVRESAYDDE